MNKRTANQICEELRTMHEEMQRINDETEKALNRLKETIKKLEGK